ncbi:glycosyltransferase [Geoalkalibacter halelectricus]|uniref:Glycosyltransferase n=1 Tax=Geoalkalibacter halelectricus TaxID=2847045 RepID=A0ABY5ZWG3_9BACT|nr:glycosyltransferase [Geoalkalibacter halelectricus]MDO3377966.1 glycosyltransferase [Geoalkalibacter halelectricus]UWZ81531.1 glycosyltransferase [Geoalkalibacter halelectricus]
MNFSIEKNRVVLFGAGSLLSKYIRWIEDIYHVVSVIDNDNKKHGHKIEGYHVFGHEKIMELNFEKIIITSMFFEEIRNQLISFGLIKENIISVYEDTYLHSHIVNGLSIEDRFKESRSFFSSLPDAGKRQDVLIIINSLGMGGAERALVDLLDKLDHKRYRFVLLALSGKGHYAKHINKKVPMHELLTSDESINFASSVFFSLSAKDLYLNIIGRRFDTCVSFLEGWSTYLVSEADCVRKIGWIHTDYSNNHWTKYIYLSLKNEAEVYSKLDSVVFVSKSGLDAFIEVFPDYRGHKTVIPNIFNNSAITLKSKDFFSFPEGICGKKVFVAVGRLVEVKGFKRLIRAFARLARVKNDIHLVIAGEGPQRKELEALVDDLSIQNHVTLLGRVENPYPLIKHGDFFISSSLAEGHPISIGEALLLERPVIATDCSGNREILNHGEFGLLVDSSEDGLYSGMLLAVTQDEFAEEYREKALSSHKRFNAENILEKVDNLLRFRANCPPANSISHFV